MPRITRRPLLATCAAALHNADPRSKRKPGPRPPPGRAPEGWHRRSPASPEPVPPSDLLDQLRRLVGTCCHHPRDGVIRVIELDRRSRFRLLGSLFGHWEKIELYMRPLILEYQMDFARTIKHVLNNAHFV